MKISFRTLLLVLLWPVLSLNSSSVFASHSFGGLDMCALYPEVMPPGLRPDQLPDAGGQGAVLMQGYCTQCHALPGPGRHTAEEWPQVLDHMLRLMDVADRFGGLLGNVKTPSASEREQLRSYLALHALKPMTRTPQGVGARAFENHCSACHVLPDPAQYSNNERSSLMKRMQRNMKVMKYSPPSADIMMQIQLYLQNNDNPVATNHVPAGDHSNNYVGLDADYNSASLYGRSFNPGSWLALGPFFMLAIIGLLRWWNNRTRATSIKQTKA